MGLWQNVDFKNTQMKGSNNYIMGEFRSSVVRAEHK